MEKARAFPAINNIVPAVMAVIFFVSCAGPAEDENEFQIPIIQSVPPVVTLAPGDEVDVKFYLAEELNESQVVRPDGIITLQLVGDILVQGKKPSEVRDHLKELFEPHLNNPEVAVIVRSLANRKVYVGGEVNAPGMIEMPGGLTALEAIMHAGGFITDYARINNVVIIRHMNGERYGCAIDFEDALQGKKYIPFRLEPNDIVYVPQTTITRVTTWIDQHINRIIPIGFTYTVRRGDATMGLDTGFSGVRGR